MDKLHIWITYHDESQVEKYKLRESRIMHLFNTTDLDVRGDSINALNQFYAEMCTMYWVWKNEPPSEMIGFEHYRRKFKMARPLNQGECQVYEIVPWGTEILNNMRTYTAQAVLNAAMKVLDTKFGDDNKYSRYLRNERQFIGRCCFIMTWEDFQKYCSFIFGVLFDMDSAMGLGMDPEKYKKAAETMPRFRADGAAEMRDFAYVAEALTSAYITYNLTYKVVRAPRQIQSIAKKHKLSQNAAT